MTTTPLSVQLENPFEYHSPTKQQQQPRQGRQVQSHHHKQQQQQQQLVQPQPTNKKYRKFSLQSFNSHLDKLKSSSTNTFKSSSTTATTTANYQDLPSLTDYKIEDQRLSFTETTTTSSSYNTANTYSSGTAPSPQFSLTPPPPPVPPKSPQYIYSHSTKRHSSIMSSPDSPFWKYHILKFGKDLYLTTNPGTKHMYCRNAPGFFIEVISQDPKHLKPTATSGYSLIFKDSKDLQDDAVNSSPYMIITKKSQLEGGFFTFSIPRNNFLNQENGLIHRINDMTVYNGVSYKEHIDATYFPYDNLRCQYPKYMRNYELRDLHGVLWNIGNIPRVRASKVNKLKEKIKESASNNHHHNQHQNEFKFIGKKNIYFHQNFISLTDESSSGIKYKEYEPKFIYGHDYGKSFPPVLSMFRPFENKTRKKIMNSVKNNKHFNTEAQSPYLEGSYEDYGTETKKFYQGSDGLYYSENTTDDLPDENKLGWITIYEDTDIFGGLENRGMFDMVLGMTLAVGYDSCLTE
ncbi:hypothetical protein SBY92_000072 [Candida maltosa Xu316]